MPRRTEICFLIYANKKGANKLDSRQAFCFTLHNVIYPKSRAQQAGLYLVENFQGRLSKGCYTFL